MFRRIAHILNHFIESVDTMSLAPPVSFPPMQDPLGDTMEMASPYQMHGDDFEIDLDIMEDQTFNADNDLDVADASPEAIHPSEQSTNDADMMDEFAEPTMIDSFQRNPESHTENKSDSGFYHGPGAYESEMLDDEDDEVAAPVSENKDGLTTSTPRKLEGGGDTDKTKDISEEPLPAQVENQLHVPEDQPQKIHEQGEELGAPEADVHRSDHNAENPDDDQFQGSQRNSPHDDTNNTENVELEPQTTSNEAVEQVFGQDEGESGEVGNHPGNQDEQQVEAQDYPESEGPLLEATHGIHHLHPVKVLYQESEISLFPPQEGDASETFFLEDEDLAHGNLGELLASCRQVLGDHVSDDEALVVHIECLNLQLSEDCLHVSKVSLAQIVELYLHLCRNDSTDEAEPLYITLSTRLTLPSEISNLVIAASKGKGISHIHGWEEYENESSDGHNDSSKVAEVGAHQHEHKDPEARHPGRTIEPPCQSETDQVVPSEKILDRAPGQSNSPDPNAINEDNVDHVHEASVVDRLKKAEKESKDDSASTFPDDQDNYKSPATHADQGDYDDNTGISHATYDSEEQTESTATLAHSSQTHTDEQQHDRSAEDNFDHEYVDPDDYDYRLEYETGEELFEGNDDQENAEDNDYSDGEVTSDETSHEEFEPNLDDSRESALASKQGAPLDAAQDPAPDYGPSGAHSDKNDDIETIPAVLNRSASNSHQHDEATPEDPLSGLNQSCQQASSTPEIIEDLLGLDEDIFASPIKGMQKQESSTGEKDVSYKLGDTDETQNIPTEFTSPTPGPADNFDEFEFDDDGYLDYDIETPEDEDAGLVDNEPTPPKCTTRKRSHEPEDEDDLAETPTPDAKRSRSS